MATEVVHELEEVASCTRICWAAARKKNQIYHDGEALFATMRGTWPKSLVLKWGNMMCVYIYVYTAGTV